MGKEIRETFRPGGRFPGFEESYINALYDKRLRESKAPEPPPEPDESEVPLSCINRLIATALACPGGICEIPDLPSTMQVFARMIRNPAAMLLLDVIRVAQRNGGRDSAASLLREFEEAPASSGSAGWRGGRTSTGRRQSTGSRRRMSSIRISMTS